MVIRLQIELNFDVVVKMVFHWFPQYFFVVEQDQFVFHVRQDNLLYDEDMDVMELLYFVV